MSDREWLSIVGSRRPGAAARGGCASEAPGSAKASSTQDRSASGADHPQVCCGARSGCCRLPQDNATAPSLTEHRELSRASLQRTMAANGEESPPLIDAQQLFSPGSAEPAPAVAAAIVAAACKWGFFQLTNQ